MYKNQFWTYQPVFHIYDIMKWIHPGGIIREKLPDINKYTNLTDIQTYTTDEIINKKMDDIIVDLIVANYILKERGSKTTYTPTQNNVFEYLRTNKHKSYCSLFFSPLREKKITAVITARPLYVKFIQTNISFCTYYVDNLCVDKGSRKQNIATTMIQTHYYNLRHKNDKINTCLFKREGKMNAIVPLCIYDVFCVAIKTIKSLSINTIPSYTSLVLINNNNLSLVIEFIKCKMTEFSCCIKPDEPDLYNLIQTGNLIIYGLMDSRKNTLISCYVFKLNGILYEECITAECVASLCDASLCDASLCDASLCDIKEMNYLGFVRACIDLEKTRQCKFIILDDTSNNNYLIDIISLNNYNNICFKTTVALFFYNYACYSINKSKMFILH